MSLNTTTTTTKKHTTTTYYNNPPHCPEQMAMALMTMKQYGHKTKIKNRELTKKQPQQTVTTTTKWNFFNEWG